MEDRIRIASNLFRVIASILLFACFVGVSHAEEWQRLPSLPDDEGFAGAFAGMSGGALIVAGGANFPDKKPWEGGTKVWYDAVYVLEGHRAEWRLAGKLPRPLGYGVSVTHDGGVVCVGGSDAERHYAQAFRLDWRDGKLITTDFPPLPMPLANACGALVGDTLYVAGGQERPDSRVALKTVLSIDLASESPAWKRLDDLPGEGRILAVAASAGGAFWIAGGAALVEGKDGSVARRYLTDAYRYEPGAGWTKIADLPGPSVAAPSPAPSDTEGFYVLGGDDGSQVDVTPEAHRGFSTTILRYDLASGRWTAAGEIPEPRVTVPCVFGFGGWIVPSGEMRPGVRSPEVWLFSPERGP
jgi:N-acetylneuraminate epimerase